MLAMYTRIANIARNSLARKQVFDNNWKRIKLLV